MYYTEAKNLAKKGLSIFPCHSMVDGNCTCYKKENCDKNNKGKHPATVNGFKEATTDETKIQDWFDTDIPRNIGIATGIVSGIWVLDLDEIGALDELEKQHGKLPRTPTAKTGRANGGQHFYFQYPDGIEIGSRIKNIPGIDVKGNGGYVVAPPSIHHTGKIYEWIISPDDCEFALAPQWLIDLVQSKDVVTHPTTIPPIRKSPKQEPKEELHKPKLKTR